MSGNGTESRGRSSQTAASPVRPYMNPSCSSLGLHSVSWLCKEDEHKLVLLVRYGQLRGCTLMCLSLFIVYKYVTLGALTIFLCLEYSGHKNNLGKDSLWKPKGSDSPWTWILPFNDG